MDSKATKKALYRAKLKEAAQKREKRIDSPLVRYNEYDQPVCRVCDVILKSESLWAAHQASRKHHEAIENVKATAAGKKQLQNAKSEPPTEFTPRSQSSSTLPVDFFDKHDTKRQKTGLGTGDKIEPGAPRASVKSVDSDETSDVLEVDANEGSDGKLSSQINHTTRQIGGSQVKQVNGALPEGFFDNKDADMTRKMGGSTDKLVKGAVPGGFFYNKDVNTIKKATIPEVEQVKGALPEGFFDEKDTHASRKMGVSEAKQAKGALPEGFFDNKEADLRARGIEPVKIDIKDEYKEFEKLIQEDLHEVDERLEEEEIDAAEVREEEETLEQKACRERVEMLKKKQMELKAARFAGQKLATMGKDSSDEDSSSDEDDNEENFAVDWRAKNL